jgi:hypothetical protein
MQRGCNAPLRTLTPADADKEVSTMCMTCGCMDAHREMGEANITYDDIKRAAEDNGRTVEETLQTFEATAAKDRREHRDEYQATSRQTA